MQDKVAIVAGRGQDIGRALTLRLAAEGCMPGETAGVTRAELNYGAAENLQLSTLLPLAFDQTGSLRAGTATCS